MKFTIPGEPTGKARPRVTKWGAHTPEKTVLYENLVKTCYDGPLFEGQLEMRVTAFYGIPKSTAKKYIDSMLMGGIRPTKKPDADNVLKIICDALNKVAYYDDKQVVEAHVSKRYSSIPHVEVEIEEVRNEV